MRILEGVGTLVQLGGLIARLCKLVNPFLQGVLFPQVTHRFLTEYETTSI